VCRHRAQDRRGASGQLLSTLRVNNDLFCDLAALVALDDASLRAADNETAAGALAGVIAKAADGAAAAGRRLLRHVLRGDQADSADGGPGFGQPARSRADGSEGGLGSSQQGLQIGRRGDVSGRGPQQRPRRRETARSLLQAQQQAGQRQQQQEAAEPLQRPPAEDAAQQAEDSGLPVLSGAGGATNWFCCI
jgi:hypothetical protein